MEEVAPGHQERDGGFGTDLLPHTARNDIVKIKWSFVRAL
jgi:hypothetical protein